jgi:hypothetical protein
MKTAVEWLVEYLTLHGIKLNNDAIHNVINQAKEMEKEQIIESYSSGYTDSSNKYRFNRDYYNTKYTLKQD